MKGSGKVSVLPLSFLLWSPHLFREWSPTWTENPSSQVQHWWQCWGGWRV